MAIELLASAAEYAKTNPVDFGLHAILGISGIALFAQGCYAVYKSVKEYEKKMEKEQIVVYDLTK